ncbi:MAG: hypothetical protein U0325_27345 [Polyangiales bacterium]
MDPHAAPAGGAAPAELVELLTTMLPEGWRHDVRVEPAPGSLTLHFRDADGHPHAFDIRPRHEDTPALVSGDALAFSYQSAEGPGEATLLLDAHRNALAALAAREAEISPWIARTLVPDAPIAQSALGTRHDLDAAPGDLATLTTSLLPEAWRHDVEVFTAMTGFVMRFRDADGQRHAFDARRLHANEPALVAGKALGFSYQVDDPALDPTRWIDRYREALAAFVAREDELAALLPAPAAHVPTAVEEPSDDEPPTPDAFRDALAAMLPEGWRREVTSTWLPGDVGAALYFRDEAGVRHMIDIRRMSAQQPALVPGAKLGFSYGVVDARLDEGAVVTKYRELFQSWLPREAELDALLGEPLTSDGASDAPA